MPAQSLLQWACVAPRPLELRPYRIAVYAAFGVVCGVLFLQLIRSVVGDLYGGSVVSLSPKVKTSTPMGCLEDVQRLYAQVAARAVQASPGGLTEGALSVEFDVWSRRFEAEVEAVSTGCGLADATEPALQEVAEALDALEELRRVLSHSGQDATREASRVRDHLAAAREQLKRK